MITTTTSIRVRYEETDMMGIVYHGNYFTWFEVGRVRMLEEIGLCYRKLEETGFRLPVLEANAKYKSPARFDDTVIIKTYVREKPRARFRIEYELFCDDRLLCTGHTVHTFTNLNGQPTRPPKHFLEKISEAIDPREYAP